MSGFTAFATVIRVEQIVSSVLLLLCSTFLYDAPAPVPPNEILYAEQEIEAVLQSMTLNIPALNRPGCKYFPIFQDSTMQENDC